MFCLSDVTTAMEPDIHRVECETGGRHWRGRCCRAWGSALRRPCSRAPQDSSCPSPPDSRPATEILLWRKESVSVVAVLGLHCRVLWGENEASRNGRGPEKCTTDMTDKLATVTYKSTLDFVWLKKMSMLILEWSICENIMTSKQGFMKGSPR